MKVSYNIVIVTCGELCCMSANARITVSYGYTNTGNFSFPHFPKVDDVPGLEVVTIQNSEVQ